jgi:hypothetical protein
MSSPATITAFAASLKETRTPSGGGLTSIMASGIRLITSCLPIPSPNTQLPTIPRTAHLAWLSRALLARNLAPWATIATPPF